ncbi:MAG: hypothetical protein ACHQ4H_16435 [Ktedonobacterales bacterium]
MNTSSQPHLRIGGIGIQMAGDPNYNKPFPWLQVTAEQATVALQQQRGIAPAASATAELVYFTPPDPVPGVNVTWTGGGTNPADPMWRLKGKDGRYHFVGTDGHVYESNQLPVVAGTTIVQS